MPKSLSDKDLNPKQMRFWDFVCVCGEGLWCVFVLTCRMPKQLLGGTHLLSLEVCVCVQGSPIGRQAALIPSFLSVGLRPATATPLPQLLRPLTLECPPAYLPGQQLAGGRGEGSEGGDQGATIGEGAGKRRRRRRRRRRGIWVT